jgi:hypothetical protein
MPGRMIRNGARYFQAQNLNADCGESCPLQSIVTQRQIPIGSQEDPTAKVPGLKHEQLVCQDHGTVWERGG